MSKMLFAADVDLLSYGLQVSRIDATSHLAEVVNDQSYWNGATGQFIGGAVCNSNPLAVSESSIALDADRALPQPTGSSLFDLAPETLRQVTRDTRILGEHWIAILPKSLVMRATKSAALYKLGTTFDRACARNRLSESAIRKSARATIGSVPISVMNTAKATSRMGTITKRTGRLKWHRELILSGVTPRTGDTVPRLFSALHFTPKGGLSLVEN